MLNKIIKMITMFILLICLVSCFSNNTTLEFPIPEETNESITIEIKGAVKMPGIYSFDKGVMLYEIINFVGGFLSNADKNNVNLIQIYNNNASIHIPYISDNSNNNKLKNHTPRKALVEYVNEIIERNL